ncbi:MAG: SprB repeat-containing protein, partial [Bacteroidota bacterium]
MTKIFTFLSLFFCSLSFVQAQCNVTLEATSSGITCAGDSDAAIFVGIGNANFPVNYELFGPVPSQGSIYQSDTTFSDLPPGNYGIFINDTIANCSLETSVIIESITELAISNANVENPTCGDFNGLITVTVEGGTPPYNYLWDDPASQNTPTLVGMPAGTYTVVVADVNGCQVSGTYTLVASPGLSGTISVISDNCDSPNSGVIQVVSIGGTPPIRYFWGHGPTTSLVTNLASGTYNVTIVDDFGCAVTLDAEITGSGAGGLSIDPILTSPSCLGLCDGGIQLRPSCGTPPYQFDWSDDALDGLENPTNLCSGVYSITLTDAMNTTIIDSLIVSEPSNITLLDSLILPTCNGTCDGELYVFPFGGNGNYTYRWALPGGEISQQQGLIDICPGDYFVTVTDRRGCEVSQSFTITDNDPLSVSIEVVNSACQDDGALAAVVSGGTAPYFYRWNNTTFDSIATGLSAAYYLVEVFDSRNCISEADFDLDDVLGLDVSTTFANCDSAGAIANADVQSSNTDIVYEWSNGGSGPTQTNLSVGGYSVTVTDNDSGCRTHETFLIQRDSNCFVRISGYVYEDFLGGCTTDSVNGLPNVLVELTNGQIDYTDDNGYYEFLSEPGTYNLSVQLDTVFYEAICIDPITVDALTLGSSYENNNFYLKRAPRQDISLKLSKPNPRPGFTRNVQICVMNLGDDIASGTLTYQYDSLHQYISSNIPPTTIDPVNRLLIWDYNDHPPGRIIVYNVQMKLPATVPLGTQISYYFRADPIAGDLQPLDNEVICYRTVVGSYDPNDKSVLPEGRGPLGLIGPDVDKLEYLVRFQNTGT